MEYHSALKRQVFAISHSMGEPSWQYAKWNKVDTKKNRYMISHISGILKNQMYRGKEQKDYKGWQKAEEIGRWRLKETKHMYRMNKSRDLTYSMRTIGNKMILYKGFVLKRMF